MEEKGFIQHGSNIASQCSFMKVEHKTAKTSTETGKKMATLSCEVEFAAVCANSETKNH